MGRAMLGHRMVLLGTQGPQASEGELGIAPNPAPTGLMGSHLSMDAGNQALLVGAHCRTSDAVRIGADGYFWCVGRADAVFKASEHRISPLECKTR
jgi:acetyl-CoA synthetase